MPMRLPKRPLKFRPTAATPQSPRAAAAQTVTKSPVTPPQSTATEAPMKAGVSVVDQETEAPAMDGPPAETQRAHGRPNPIIERRLAEFDAYLTEALGSRPRRSDVDGSLFEDIRRRTEFLRTMITTERDSHRGARPDHLVVAEEWFGVLERTIEQWAESGVPAATEGKEEPDQAAAGSLSGSSSGSGSGSGGCSCTGSCSGFEVTGQEAALVDAKCDPESEGEEVPKVAAAAAAAATEAIEVPPATRTTPRRRCWRRRAALCGLAGVVAVAALGAGLALQFAAVAQQSVYVVPT